MKWLLLTALISPAAFGTESAPPVAPVAPVAKEVYGPHDVLSPEEAKTLLSNFDAAIEMKKKAFLHRTGLQRKDMLKALEGRRAKWSKDENAKMAEYRQLNPNLKPDEYVKQSESRRVDFLKALQEEQIAFEGGLKAKQEKLDKNLLWRRSEAKRIIEQGERPPRDLWP